MAQPTLTACYAHFGITVKNPRRLWSAVSPSGRVVVTLWADHFDDQGMTRYSLFGKPFSVHRRENRLRADQLAAVGIGGTFESIVQTRRDLTERPPRARMRSIGPTTRSIGPTIGPTMRLLKLNGGSGAFRAEVVARGA